MAEWEAARLSASTGCPRLGGAGGLFDLLFLFLGEDSVWGPSACAGITCPRVAAGSRPCGGGQHAAGVGQGGEEESCLRSAH